MNQRTVIPPRKKASHRNGRLAAMTDAELNAKLKHSYEQAATGKGRPFREVFDELEQRLS
jgi:hypothetical protein